MALWGDWMAKNGISRMLEAARRSDDLVALAQRLGNDEYVLQAHHSRWTNFYMMGDARISRADTLVGIRLYDRERHRHHRHIYGGHDPGICACGTGANAAWLTGYADDALATRGPGGCHRRGDRAPVQPVHRIHVGDTGCVRHARLRAGAGACRGLVGVGRSTQLPGVARRGDGGVRRLPGACGRDRVRTQIDWRRARRATPGRQWELAGIHTRDSRHGPHAMRQPRSRARAADGSVGPCRKVPCQGAAPEIERLHAEVQLLTGQIDTRQAIARVEAAAAHARQQGALALEWRATMALARLYAGVGRHDEARAMLRRNYAAFTEGFASPDLVEGERLLRAMS